MLSEQLQAFKQAVIKHTQAKEELSVSLKKRIALVRLICLCFFFSFRTQIHPALCLLFLSADEKRKLCVNRVESCFNPLSPNSDQHQFSPNNIHILSTDKVMRINKMIAKEKCVDHVLNSLNSFLKEMYDGDHFGEFLCVYL